MPEIIKPKITVNYSVEEVTQLVKADLERIGFFPEDFEIKPIFSGGYKDCDCNSWGGPSVGECRCPITPVVFKGYTITTTQE